MGTGNRPRAIGIASVGEFGGRRERSTRGLDLAAYDAGKLEGAGCVAVDENGAGRHRDYSSVNRLNGSFEQELSHTRTHRGFVLDDGASEPARDEFSAAVIGPVRKEKR